MCVCGGGGGGGGGQGCLHNIQVRDDALPYKVCLQKG